MSDSLQAHQKDIHLIMRRLWQLPSILDHDGWRL